MLADEALKILIVDDHSLIRQGLKPVLAELAKDVSILESGDFPEALTVIAANPDIDLILLDLNLPSTVGLSALIDIQESYEGIPVVVLSGYADKATVLGAFERGASGFIPKSTPPSVLLAAIRVVLAGGVYIPPEAAIQASVSAEKPEEAPPLSAPTAVPDMVGKMGLTERQTDVLKLILQGKPNKIISRELGMAIGTVKNHVAAILRVFNASSRTQVVIMVQGKQQGR